MSYNLTSISDNMTGGLSFVQGVNSVLMDGMLGVLFLLIVGGISLLTFLSTTNDFGRSLLATAFICFGLSLLLVAMSLIPMFAVWVCVILLGVGFVIVWKQ